MPPGVVSLDRRADVDPEWERIMLIRQSLAAMLMLLTGPGTAMAQAAEPSDTKLQTVTNSAQVQAIEARLQAQLNRIGGAQIKGCGPVLRLIAPQTSGLDETSGGSCALEVGASSLSALMCQDSRDRQFALTLTPVADMDAMRRFFVENCYPSG